MRVLVTGSSGHLGAALVRALQARDNEVIGVDLLAFCQKRMTMQFVKSIIRASTPDRAGATTSMTMTMTRCVDLDRLMPLR